MTSSQSCQPMLLQRRAAPGCRRRRAPPPGGGPDAGGNAWSSKSPTRACRSQPAPPLYALIRLVVRAPPPPRRAVRAHRRSRTFAVGRSGRAAAGKRRSGHDNFHELRDPSRRHELTQSGWPQWPTWRGSRVRHACAPSPTCAASGSGARNARSIHSRPPARTSNSRCDGCKNTVDWPPAPCPGG